MEMRVSRLETSMARLATDGQHTQGDLKEIKSDIRDIKKEARTDFRLLFGTLITTTLALATLIAREFAWL